MFLLPRKISSWWATLFKRKTAVLKPIVDPPSDATPPTNQPASNNADANVSTVPQRKETSNLPQDIQMQITAKESNTLVLAPSSPPQVPQRPAHPGAAVHELGETKTSRAPQTIKNRAPRKKVVADGQGKVQDIAQITMDQLPKESTVAVEQPNGLVSLPSSPPQQVQQRPAHSDATEYESPETEVTQPPQTIKNRQPRKVVTEEERRTEDNAQTVTTRSLERKEEELEDNARPSPIATPWKRQPRKVVAKGEDGIQASRTADNISAGTEAGRPPWITGERQPRKPKVATEASEDSA